MWLEPNGVKAKADFEQVSASIVGIAITNVHGEVNYSDSMVFADLRGQALGSEVAGHYSANLSEEHWQGEIQGSPRLA